MSCDWGERPSLSEWLHCSKPRGLEVVSQHGLDLAQRSIRNSPLTRVAQSSGYWAKLRISLMMLFARYSEAAL